MNIKKKIILASSSPRRQFLFRQIGFDFEIVPSNFEEVFDTSMSPQENALKLSKAKAFDIAEKFQNAFVVGADTIVVLNGDIMGKPRDDSDALLMLKKMSGREHIVYTGFTIVDRPSNKFISEIESTAVKFRDLDQEEIINYIKSGSPADKAGAYGIQDDYGALFVEKIDGCFYNVVGFPLTKFYITLKKFQSGLGK
jgi:septum formation protein